MSWQLGAFALLALAILAGFAWYERERPDARIVALVGTLAAFAALGRIAFAALPNVKPTTDIVLISGYALGGGPGFAVGALAGLTSNFFFGQGPWTPWQMAAWGVTGVIGAGLAWAWSARARRGFDKRLPAGGAAPGKRLRLPAGAGRDPVPIGRWPLALVCLVVGFAFTVVQDVGDWVSYSDHSWAQLGVYVGRGLGFDAVHAAGCLAFALAFGPALNRSIARFARRLQVTWIRPGVAAPLIVCGLAVPLASGLGAAGTARAAGSPVTYLLGAQNGDGGFGAAPHQASVPIYSGWAALGLASAGQDLRRVARGSTGLMAYIRTTPGSTSDVGSLERTILAVRAAGLSARRFAGRDLVAALSGHIRPDGAVANQVNLTAFAVLALRAAGLEPPARTIGWLDRQQDRDGGFSFAGAGSSSDIDDTGAALEALADRGGASAGVRRRAVVYLRRQQNRDGGFPQQPGGDSNAQSTAWALQGLDAAHVAPGSVRRGGSPTPVAYLRSLIAPDGHIRYARGADQTPVWVTGQAIMALEGKPLPFAAPAAARSSSPAPSPSPPTSSTTAAATAGSGAPARGSAASPARHAPAVRRRSAGIAVAGAGSPGAGSAAGVRVARFSSAVGLATALVLAPLDLG
ncbi:MAG TPA: prenyltransferase/squalene oxidase repeat-containing protein [Solirubrobacteraceae bacterium]